VTGLTITRNKQTVYVSVGPGTIAIDVEKAVSGEVDPIVGFLRDTVGTTSIEGTLSSDDKYVFVSQEDGSNTTSGRGAIEVFNVIRANNGSVLSTYVGFIALGRLAVGTALPSDGSKLYATSETANSNSTQGILSVLDVETLKKDPSKALIASVDTGCGPVQVAVSPNGKHVWVTARESNMLLAFDAAKLDSNQSNALLASVQVGTQPAGLAFVNHGRHIITADSNASNHTNANTGLTVVDAEAALNGKQGFPRIPTGLYPREFAVSLDGKTLLVSQYYSDAVQAVDVSELAWD
jgi:DNA-binding beta-propeller fold protein YncE